LLESVFFTPVSSYCFGGFFGLTLTPLTGLILPGSE